MDPGIQYTYFLFIKGDDARAAVAVPESLIDALHPSRIAINLRDSV